MMCLHCRDVVSNPVWMRLKAIFPDMEWDIVPRGSYGVYVAITGWTWLLRVCVHGNLPVSATYRPHNSFTWRCECDREIIMLRHHVTIMQESMDFTRLCTNRPWVYTSFKYENLAWSNYAHVYDLCWNTLQNLDEWKGYFKSFPNFLGVFHCINDRPIYIIFEVIMNYKFIS